MEQEFSESDKPLKHELELVQRSCVSYVSCWCCGNILVLFTRGGWVTGLSPFNDKYFCH